MADQPLTWKCFEVVIPTEDAPKLAYWLNRELGPLDKFGDRRGSGMTVRFAGATTDGELHAYVTYTVRGGWASDMWRLNPPPGSPPAKAFEKVAERGGLLIDFTKGAATEILRCDLEALGAVVEKGAYPTQSDLLWNRCKAFLAGLRGRESRFYMPAWHPEGTDDVPSGFQRDGVAFSRSEVEVDGWVWMRAYEWADERSRLDSRPTGCWMPKVFDQGNAQRLQEAFLTLG